MNVTPLRITDTAVAQGTTERVIRYRRSSSKDLYRVVIFLEGLELPYVKRVTYLLHPTFTPRERVVDRTASNPNCQMEIYTWGVFEVEAKVDMKDGRQTTLSHYLTYDQELNAPRTKFVLEK